MMSAKAEEIKVSRTAVPTKKEEKEAKVVFYNAMQLQFDVQFDRYRPR